MSKITQSDRWGRPGAAAAAGLLLLTCVFASACLESLPPDLDPQDLSLVAAPPGSSFEGLYKWAATTLTGLTRNRSAS